jgi:putative transposase
LTSVAELTAMRTLPEQAAATAMVTEAKARGPALTARTACALNEEIAEHLGHEKHAAGEVDINVPRDRESTFEPQIV